MLTYEPLPWGISGLSVTAESIWYNIICFGAVCFWTYCKRPFSIKMSITVLFGVLWKYRIMKTISNLFYCSAHLVHLFFWLSCQPKITCLCYFNLLMANVHVHSMEEEQMLLQLLNTPTIILTLIQTVLKRLWTGRFCFSFYWLLFSSIEL